MKKITLQVGTSELDIDNSTRIATTLSINDISDLTQREGTATKEFTINATKNNQQVLQFLNQLPSQGSFGRYREVDAILRVNEIVILEGIAKVKNHSQLKAVGQYGVEIKSDNLDWSTRIGNDMLTDLQCPELDHDYTALNIKQSWEGDIPYLYPLIDYGLFAEYTDATPMAVRDFLPGVFVKYLVEKIFARLGYRLAPGGFFAIEQHQKLFLPFSNQSFEHTLEWVEDRSLTATKAGSQAVGGSGPDTITFTSVTSGNDAGYFASSQYTAAKSVRIIVNLETNQAATPTDYGLYINGVLSGSTQSAGGASFAGEFTADLQAGDVMTMKFANPGALILNGAMTITAASAYLQDSNIEGSTILPVGLSQIDLIKTLFQMFGLYIVTDTINKTILLQSYSRFYKNAIPGDTSTYVDWSNKLSIGEQISQDYGQEWLGRENTFKFREAAGDANIEPYNKLYPELNYGDGAWIVDDLRLDDSKEMADLAISSTFMGESFSGNLFIPKINLVQLVDTDLLFGGSSVPKMLMYGGKVAVNQLSGNAYAFLTFDGVNPDMPYAWSWRPDTITPTQLDGYIVNPVFEKPVHSLGMYGQSLIEYAYQEHLTFLERTVKITARFLLNEIDIAALDFSKPIYVDYLDGYFRLNAVRDYLVGDNATCIVELLYIT